MPHAMTILLTARDPALFGAIEDLHPDLAVRPLHGEIPDDGLTSPLWCFVDWLLPDISGLEMVRRLREARATRAGHITMVLEESDADAARRALRAGADDYLVGPLDPARLAGRLRLDQSAAPVRGGRLEQGGLSVDLSAHQARWQGAPIALRPNELRLLTHFMEHPDQVFSRAALIDRLGKDQAGIDERTVDVWVGRLRRALAAHGAPDPLRTVRSLGYVLDSVDG